MFKVSNLKEINSILTDHDEFTIILIEKKEKDNKEHLNKIFKNALKEAKISSKLMVNYLQKPFLIFL
jgi:hypothetical protein